MALAVDTRNLAEEWCSDHEGHLDAIAGNQRRFQLHRVSVHVSVVQDDVPTKELKELRSKPISREKRAMLDWQPDARDDQDVEEILHHLKELGATMKLSTNSKSMVAFAECPNFLVRSGGKPASTFRQYSVKCSMLRSDPSEAHGYYLITHTDLQVACFYQLGNVFACGVFLCAILHEVLVNVVFLCQNSIVELLYLATYYSTS